MAPSIIWAHESTEDELKERKENNQKKFSQRIRYAFAFQRADADARLAGGWGGGGCSCFQNFLPRLPRYLEG